MKIDSLNLKKVLVIQLKAIGDVVTTTSVLPVLRAEFPNAEIHFLTTPGVDELLEGLPELDRVLSYPYGPNNIPGFLRFAAMIRRAKYDLIVDYQISPATALLTFLSGASWRLSWKMDRRQWAYNRISAANRENSYVTVQKCRALEQIGIFRTNVQTKISIDSQEEQKVDRYFSELGIDRNCLIINISPRGKRPARQWIPEKIARLTDLLIDRYGAQVFFNRAPGEQEYVKRVADLAKNKIHVLPQWHLKQFAAFLSKIDLHFSYDNGPKHIATAAGAATLALFATDNPVLWNIQNDPRHPFVVSSVPCRYCRLRACPLMICMKQIEPEAILKEIIKIPDIRKKIPGIAV